MCATYGRETWPDFDSDPVPSSVWKRGWDVPGKLWQRQPAGHQKEKTNTQTGTGAKINWQNARKKDLGACVYIKRYVSHKKCLQKYFIVHVASQQTEHYEYISGSRGRASAGMEAVSTMGRIEMEFFRLHRQLELIKAK